MQHRMTVTTEQWKTKGYLIVRNGVARRERVPTRRKKPTTTVYLVDVGPDAVTITEERVRGRGPTEMIPAGIITGVGAVSGGVSLRTKYGYCVFRHRSPSRVEALYQDLLRFVTAKPAAPADHPPPKDVMQHRVTVNIKEWKTKVHMIDQGGGRFRQQVTRKARSRRRFSWSASALTP